jgi:short subunit dehydrogenase-like uncharacterized protein
MEFLLYGATGYTGRLIAEQAVTQGLRPTLAGRSANQLKAMAESLDLPWLSFELSDQAALETALRQTSLVVHAAGPFIHTARPMMEACMRTGTHYLDITGEIAVFEMAARLGDRARDAGIMLMPGVGFDVVPTDCLAKYLSDQMPDATHLQLGFAGLGGVSRGTATTMAENLGEMGACRKNGKISKVPIGHKTLTIPFRVKPMFAMTIPWGDVSTAFYSTGIPNIETYMTISPKAYRWVRMQRYINWLLKLPAVRGWVKGQISKRPAGPSEKKRLNARSYVWGKVSNAAGKTLEAQLDTLEGYTLTAATTLIIAQKVLNGEVALGFQTPAGAYGADLILEVDSTKRFG